MTAEEEEHDHKSLLALRRTSPLVIVFLICIVTLFGGLLKSYKTGNCSLIVFPLFGSIGLFSILLDYFIKKMIPQGALKIWLIELCILVIGLAYYIWK